MCSQLFLGDKCLSTYNSHNYTRSYTLLKITVLCTVVSSSGTLTPLNGLQNCTSWIRENITWPQDSQLRPWYACILCMCIYIYNTLLFYFIWIELCRAHPWPKTKSKYVTNETLLIYRLHWSLLASSTSASSSSSTSSWIEKRTLRTSSNPPRCGAQKTTEELSILREYVIILPSHLLFFVFLLCT